MRRKIIIIKAKDTPWDAVLMGSVVCTVGAKVQHFFFILQFFFTFFILSSFTRFLVIQNSCEILSEFFYFDLKFRFDCNVNI